jgi:hypothetical protein
MTSLLTPGDIVHNRYRIVHLLGKGGYGAVYLAEDLIKRERCAIKESFDNSPDAQAQFAVEATILMLLNHPGLTPVTAHFTGPSGRPYLVMEYVEGEDLSDILDRTGSLPEDRVLAWMEPIFNAVEYLHTYQPRPIIHRDIKPSNIRLRKVDGRAILVDFGIVKIGGVIDPTRNAAKGATSGFSPPEQYGTGTDTYSDVYALGATLYNLLTGEVPPESIDIAHSGATLKPPRYLNPNISPLTDQVILQAMSIDPAHRYKTAGQMWSALMKARVPIIPCPYCRADMRVGAKFCPVCGRPVALPFDVKQVAVWSAGGAAIGTVLAYLPWLAMPSGAGPVLEAATYAGALLFGAVGAVIGAFIAHKVNLDAPDFLPKVVVSLITTLALEIGFGLVLGAFLTGGGLGPPSLFLAFLGSVGGGIAGIRLTETETFRRIKW